jgi:hypothetical protein
MALHPVNLRAELKVGKCNDLLPGQIIEHND